MHNFFEINALSKLSNFLKIFKTPSGADEVFLNFLVRGQGLEPRLTEPKPVVLPLDDPRILQVLRLVAFMSTAYSPASEVSNFSESSALPAIGVAL